MTPSERSGDLESRIVAQLALLQLAVLAFVYLWLLMPLKPAGHDPPAPTPVLQQNPNDWFPAPS